VLLILPPKSDFERKTTLFSHFKQQFYLFLRKSAVFGYNEKKGVPVCRILEQISKKHPQEY